MTRFMTTLAMSFLGGALFALAVHIVIENSALAVEPVPFEFERDERPDGLRPLPCYAR